MILENKHLKIKFTPYGASIQSLTIKKLNREVIYGYLNDEDYKINKDYMGCIVGRSAGRIRNAIIYDNDKEYLITKNFEQKHNLHGGKGLHNKKFLYKKEDSKITFYTNTPHLYDGFFGECDIKVTYELIDNKIKLTLEATTPKKAYINLTNHVAFNLNHDKNIDILNHKLYIDANQMINLDKDFIPSEIVKVDKVFDFRTPKQIGLDINTINEQLEIGKGYDHPYILNGEGLRKVCSLEVDDLKLNLSTTFPCLVLYIGNFMPPRIKLMAGESHYRGSIALEAQGIPNNQEFKKYKNQNIITNKDPLKETIIWEFELT
jgi:aldose 1-epimerase